ncbi:type II toxin-antitoxin system VapC family toxin [Rathayibacter soli]|uniref:type II toxin-antitoxin system VapC family toxin n=1 Tax=Rathayibacter soli TaxID=3144168 RepID=UPI0027E47093|nr:type II toxin-antitoxin system VapC family toxin [Glaciibacter superstes]
MIVVDTNVISELMRPSPARVVADWVRAQSQRELYTTAVTLAEVRYGIERLDAGRRKEQFAITADEVFAAFGQYILPFDSAAALHYATIVSARDRAGAPIDGFDAQIAAICRNHNAILATRNVKDFQGTGIEITDPWQVG